MRFLVSLCLALVLGLASSAQAQESVTPSVPQLLDQAQRYGIENSWSMACDTYRKALPQITDLSERRRVTLALAKASLRADPEPNDYQAVPAWQKKQLSVVHAVLALYPDKNELDEVWAEASVLSIALKAKRYTDLHTLTQKWNSFLDDIAARPASPSNERLYFRALASLLEDT